MKTFFFILVAMAFLNNAHAQQWISLNPNPTGVNINAVQMFSNNHGYMIGEGGTFLEYNGTDWEIVTSFPFNGNMSSMCFLNENNGWITTEGGEIYHFDGTNWTIQFDDPSVLFFSIHLSDNNNGWAVGLNGTVVKYNGSSWVKEEEITDETLWTVYCMDATHAWAAGNTELFFYNGIEWSAVIEGAECAFIDFHFNSATDGIAYTNQAMIYTYNGTSWTKVDINDGGFDDVEVISATNIWAITDLGSIWHFNGTTWELIEEEIVPNYGSFNGLDFSDSTHGWAVGSSGNIYFYDGIEWIKYTDGFSEWLNDMDYADENNVWLVGDESFIYYYNGLGWNQQTCPLSNMTIRNIEVLSPNNVWALAGDWDNNYMLHYDGSAWSTNSTLTQDFMYGLDMINDSLGWACGSGGDIIKYDGTSWSSFVNIPSAYLYQIAFASENNGWAGGYIGEKFYHFDGASWSEYALSGVSNDFQLNAFEFTSPTNGWAVAREKYSWTPTGWILHYNGTDWTVVLEVPESPFEGIEMINDTLGWAVGEQTYKYNGTEWLPWPDNLPNEVNGVCFTNEETGWSYGANGIFYMYNPDYHVGFDDQNLMREFLDIVIYPNPTSDIITLSISDYIGDMNVSLFNTQGALILREDVMSGQINISSIPDGTYFIKVIAKGRVYSSGVIKY